MALRVEHKTEFQPINTLCMLLELTGFRYYFFFVGALYS